MPREQDFDAASADEEAFADFVARTREQTTRTAYALTGSMAVAGRISARAYAQVRGRWGRLQGTGAEAFLRASLLRAAVGATPDPQALDAVSETGWPAVEVPLDEVQDLWRRDCSRRRWLAAGGIGLGAAVLGVCGWWLVDGMTGDSNAESSRRADPDLHVVDSRTVVVDSSLTVKLDLLAGSADQRHLALRRGWEPIATVRLHGGNQLIRFAHPQNASFQLLVAVCEPASWVHIAGSYHDRLNPSPQTLGGVTVAVGSAVNEYGYDTLVVGTTAGTVAVWPGERGEGVLWPGERDLWVYRLEGEVTVFRAGVVHNAQHHQDFHTLQTVRLGDGGLIFAIDGTDVEVTGTPAPRMRYLEYGQVGYCPPSSSPNHPVLRWKDWEGTTYSLTLDERL